MYKKIDNHTALSKILVAWSFLLQVNTAKEVNNVMGSKEDICGFV